jgi:hypothetical protein
MADAIDVLIHLRQIEHVERLVLGRISVHGNFSMLPKFSVMSETRASLAAGTLAGEPGPRPPPPCPPRPCGGVVVASPWPFPNAAPPSALMAAAPAAVLARNRRRCISIHGQPTTLRIGQANPCIPGREECGFLRSDRPQQPAAAGRARRSTPPGACGKTMRRARRESLYYPTDFKPIDRQPGNETIRRASSACSF